MPETTKDTIESVFSENEKQSVMADLFKAGTHMGHQKSKSHPKMNDFVFATRHNIKLMDLSRTLERSAAAADFMAKILNENSTILVVGTKAQTRDIIKEFAAKLGQPVVAERWLGGMLTNFKTIRKRIDYYENLLKKRETGELEKYTKKEKSDFNKELSNLEKKFKDLTQLKSLPKAIFIVDIKKHETAVNEAKICKIPVIAIVDTDSDPEKADYAIPANDDIRSSVKAMTDLIISLIAKFRSQKTA